MTRREQIEKAAAKLFNWRTQAQPDFIAGAEWADANPNVVQKSMSCRACDGGRDKNSIECMACGGSGESGVL